MEKPDFSKYETEKYDGKWVLTQSQFEQAYTDGCRDFSDCYFSDVIFGNLSRTESLNLKGSTFHDCDFRGVNLKECDMSNTSIYSTDFRDTVISDCDFSNSTLAACSFCGNSSLESNNFTNSALRQCTFNFEYNLEYADKGNFQGNKFINTTFDGTNIYCCNMQANELEKCNFTMGGARTDEIIAYEERMLDKFNLEPSTDMTKVYVYNNMILMPALTDTEKLNTYSQTKEVYLLDDIDNISTSSKQIVFSSNVIGEENLKAWELAVNLKKLNALCENGIKIEEYELVDIARSIKSGNCQYVVNNLIQLMKSNEDNEQRLDIGKLYGEIRVYTIQDVYNRLDEIELLNNGTQLLIYNVKETPECRDLRFSNSDYLNHIGASIDKNNYDLVYFSKDNGDTHLDELYSSLQNDKPLTYMGHTLSVSDIIVQNNNGKVSCHFVDRIGFKEVPDFLKKPEPVSLAIRKNANRNSKSKEKKQTKKHDTMER